MAAVLGSANLGPSVFLVFYCNFVKRGAFATKFCTHSVADNMNKYCKFGYCMIFTSSCVHILWLNCTYQHTIQPQYMQGSKNHTVAKFAAFVHVICGTMCTKFCSKRTTVEKVIVKS